VELAHEKVFEFGRCAYTVKNASSELFIYPICRRTFRSFKKTIKFSGKMREFWGQNRRMGKEKQVGAGAKGAQKQKQGYSFRRSAHSQLTIILTLQITHTVHH
jgi:hypothetical protein